MPEFTVHLTGQNRIDLWLFVYRLQGVKATTRDDLRSLDAVCETFKLKEIQAKVDEAVLEKRDLSLSPKDLDDVVCPSGSVDLKRLYGYLETMPEGASTDLKLRMLALSDYLQDVKDKRPKLDSVPEGA